MWCIHYKLQVRDPSLQLFTRIATISMKRWMAALATLAPLSRRQIFSAANRHSVESHHTISWIIARGGVGRLSSTLLAANKNARCGMLSRQSMRSLSVRGGASEAPEYVTLAQPAPGSPFHYAFPVHNLEMAKEFYAKVLGCAEGRSSDKWQDFSLHGHQIVCHWVGNDYRCQDYYNPVDGDEVPVPHAGIALTVEQFHALADRVKRAGVDFIIEPHLRFKGMPGEQFTMFFKDPSGNNLEFKAMTSPENLFAKYNVADE